MRFSGLDFREFIVSPDDVEAKRELLLLAPSILVPCLQHDGIKVWDTSNGQLVRTLLPDVRSSCAVFSPAAVIPAVTHGWSITDAATICAALCVE